MTVIASTQNASYSNGTNTAGSTANGAAIDCTSAGTTGSLKVTFSGSITNGATGPTIPASFNAQWSANNSTWFTIRTSTASITLNAVLNFCHEIFVPGGFVRGQITGNTGQSVTYDVDTGTGDKLV